MPRLLYLCIHPRNRSPSQRYRFEQFESYLGEHGFEVEYSSALSEEDLPIFYGSKTVAEKVRIAARAMARRIASVCPRVTRPRFDVVLVQKEAFFLFGAWAEWAAHLQAPVVLDFDDAIWIKTTSEANRRFQSLKSVDKVRRNVAMATSVVAGNDYLATWARQFSDSVRVIPTCVDTERYKPAMRAASRPPVIGWCGSPSTIPHLKAILPALERLKKTFGNRVELRVMGDPEFRHEPLRLVGEPWNDTAELSFLQAMDIGLMPLPNDEWSKGKCGLKGLTSMSCGAATVMSPVGVNSSIVKHGVNGLLAGGEDDWYETLSSLVLNHGLRERLGTAGRATVIERFSVAGWRKPFLDTISEALAKPHRT